MNNDYYDLVVRNGLVVDEHHSYRGDVAIRGERIEAVGLDLRGEREIDASGLLVLPGAIDGHVHMRTDRATDVYDDTFATGSTAAAFGGVTTMLDQAQVEAHEAVGDPLGQQVPRRGRHRGDVVTERPVHQHEGEHEHQRLERGGHQNFSGNSRATTR